MRRPIRERNLGAAPDQGGPAGEARQLLLLPVTTHENAPIHWRPRISSLMTKPMPYPPHLAIIALMTLSVLMPRSQSVHTRCAVQAAGVQSPWNLLCFDVRAKSVPPSLHDLLDAKFLVYRV